MSVIWCHSGSALKQGTAGALFKLSSRSSETTKMARNYASPYTKPMPQYPSQSEDYLSLEIGGPGQSSTPARPQHNTNSGCSSSNYYPNKQRGRGNTYNRIYNAFASRGATTPGSQQYTPHQQGGGRWNNTNSANSWFGQPGRQWRGGGNRQRNNRQQSKTDDISAYVHTSMLEDPWEDLMKRHNAIKHSKLNLQTPAMEQTDEAPAEAADSTSDSGSEEVCSA